MTIERYPPGLVDFLLARFAEDEADAQAEIAAGYNGYADPGWDSDRVLAECEAKRKIVERYRWTSLAVDTDREYGYRQALTFALQALAMPYSSHPDYQQKWKPS